MNDGKNSRWMIWLAGSVTVILGILAMITLSGCIGYAKHTLKDKDGKVTSYTESYYFGFIKTEQVEMKSPTEGLVKIGGQ